MDPKVGRCFFFVYFYKSFSDERENTAFYAVGFKNPGKYSVKSASAVICSGCKSPEIHSGKYKGKTAEIQFSSDLYRKKYANSV